MLFFYFCFWGGGWRNHSCRVWGDHLGARDQPRISHMRGKQPCPLYYRSSPMALVLGATPTQQRSGLTSGDSQVSSVRGMRPMAALSPAPAGSGTTQSCQVSLAASKPLPPSMAASRFGPNSPSWCPNAPTHLFPLLLPLHTQHKLFLLQSNWVLACSQIALSFADDTPYPTGCRLKQFSFWGGFKGVHTQMC